MLILVNATDAAAGVHPAAGRQGHALAAVPRHGRRPALRRLSRPRRPAAAPLAAADALVPLDVRLRRRQRPQVGLHQVGSASGRKPGIAADRSSVPVTHTVEFTSKVADDLALETPGGRATPGRSRFWTRETQALDAVLDSDPWSRSKCIACGWNGRFGSSSCEGSRRASIRECAAVRQGNGSRRSPVGSLSAAACRAARSAGLRPHARLCPGQQSQWERALVSLQRKGPTTRSDTRRSTAKAACPNLN